MSAGRRLLVVVLVACSAWGAWLSFAVLKGRLPEPWARRSLAGSAPALRGGASSSAATTAVPAAGSDCACAPTGAGLPARAGQPAAPALERYVVCGREEAPPVLAELRGLAPNATRLAVHCGSSLHLIALGDAAAPQPQRVAQLNASSPSPAEALRAVTPLAADLNADGRNDLLAPLLLVDAQGHPRGGALHVLRARAEGGFEPAQRALEVAPGALAAVHLRAGAGEDLALVQLGAPQLARANELWIVRSGAAPLRSATRSAAGMGAAALAVADLDRDGLDDIAVTSEGEGKVRLCRGAATANNTAPALGGGASADTEPASWDVPGVREVLAADLDGDGARDLVLLGTRIWLVLAKQGEPEPPRELAASDGLRELHALDVDRDQRLDLIGYAHPALIALLQTQPLAFERRTIATLAGDAAVYSARLIESGPTSAPIAWITTFGSTAPARHGAGLSSGNEPTVEIAFARDVVFGTRIELGARVRPLPDAPLVERFGLR